MSLTIYFLCLHFMKSHFHQLQKHKKKSLPTDPSFLVASSRNKQYFFLALVMVLARIIQILQDTVTNIVMYTY